jgi:hypothetical protein
MPYFDPENPTDEVQHWLHFIMRSAVGEIDSTFGDGYAKAHPELVGSYLQAGASMLSAKKIGDSLGEIAGATNEVVFAIDRAEFFGAGETE